MKQIDWTFAWLMLAVLVTKAKGQPPIFFTSYQLYDKFSAPTSMIYEGGYAEVYCRTLNCDKTDLIKLIDKNEDTDVVAESFCDPDPNARIRDNAILRLNFTASTKLTEYVCKHKLDVDLKSSLPVRYRICADNSQACVNTNSITCYPYPPKFCITTKTGTNPCATIDASVCDARSSVYYCPGDHTSLCHSYSRSNDDFKAMYWQSCEYSVFQKEPARSVHGATRLKYKGQSPNFGEPIQIDAQNKIIDVYCPEGTRAYDKNLYCLISQPVVSTIAFVYEKRHCKGEHQVKLHDDLFNGSNVFKFECKIVDAVYPKPETAFDWTVFSLSRILNHLVIFGNHNFATSTTNGADGKITKIEFRLDPLPSADFKVEYFSKTPNNSLISGNVTRAFEGQTGDYTMMALLTYKTCAPHRKFEFWIGSSGEHLVAPPPQKCDGAFLSQVTLACVIIVGIVPIVVNIATIADLLHV